MNKIFVILSLIVCSCATGPKSLSFDDALGTGMQKIQNDLPEGSQIAILDFKSDNENLSSYTIEEMYDKLINFGKLSIMERNRTNTIAIEVGYQLSGEVDDNEIINIGHQLGADYVVTGQITFSGEAYRLRIFAIDIEKGRRVASSSLNINRNDRQINHLISTRATSNVPSTEQTNANMRDNKEVLSIVVQNLFKNIPINSRIFLTNFVGTNEFEPQYVRSVISEEARGMIIITEEQRQSAINAQRDLLSGEYDNNSVVQIGRMAGANIIITGGVFGNGETRRMVFRALDVQTAQIVSESCVLFRRNNTELINDVEYLSQKINNSVNNKIPRGTGIFIFNRLGTSRNADFIFDILENNLVNSSKYRIVTRNDMELIRNEQNFQFSGHVSEETAVHMGEFISAQYVINIESENNKIQIRILGLEQGNTVAQETM